MVVLNEKCWVGCVVGKTLSCLLMIVRSTQRGGCTDDGTDSETCEIGGDVHGPLFLSVPHSLLSLE